MDHLPLPSNPAIGRLEVPFWCTKDYDGDEFRSYGDRHGWRIECSDEISFTRNGGLIQDDTTIGSFLQTWLYLGLISSVTEQQVTRRTFRARTESGRFVFSSACLESIIAPWSSRISNAPWAANVLQLNDWVQSVLDRLEIAQDHCVRVAETQQGDNKSGSLLRICLSIGVLCEYIGQAIKQIYVARSVWPSARASWRFSTDIYSEPIRELMRQNHWCPNKLAYFEASEGASNGLLWYYANVRPPQVYDRHESCTPKECQSLQVDLDEYQTRHLRTGCDCPSHHSARQRLAELVHEGTMPLAVFEDGQLKIIAKQEDTEYIATSHVWADGYGNRTENSLPACVLDNIQQFANRAMERGDSANVPFWIDTLCLPRFPTKLRRYALRSMDQVFRRAHKVLVLDSHLRSLRSDCMTPVELFAHVKASHWTSRLWTYLEGRLSRRLCFQFMDKTVDLIDVAQAWRTTYSDLPALASHEVDLAMFANYTTSEIMAEDTLEDIELRFMRLTMTARSTSWAPDEALCIGYILGLPMTPILEAEDDKKMQALWPLVPNIPAGIVFSTATQKICADGLRWAPISFMGDIEEHISSWIRSTELDDTMAKATTKGLEIVLPSLVFRGGGQPAKEMLFESILPESLDQSHEPIAFIRFQCTQGRWYEAYFENDWHQQPVPVDLDQDIPGIILTHSLYHPTIQDTVNHGGLNMADHLDAVLVSYSQTQQPGNVIYARAHRHVRIYLSSPQRQVLMDSVNKCVEFMLNRHGKKIGVLRKGSRAKLIDHLLAWMKKAANYTDMRKRCKECLIAEGEDDSDDAVTQKCLQLVYYLFWMDGWHQVEEPKDPVKWCVD